VAVKSLPRRTNPVLKHDEPGILGMSSPNGFYLTTGKQAGFDRRYVAVGKVVAGIGVLAQIEKDDPIRSVRIYRVGKAAREFKTDDAAFKVLMDGK